jgi:hypothetical protein
VNIVHKKHKNQQKELTNPSLHFYKSTLSEYAYEEKISTLILRNVYTQAHEKHFSVRGEFKKSSFSNCALVGRQKDCNFWIGSGDGRCRLFSLTMSNRLVKKKHTMRGMRALVALCMEWR